MSDTEQRVQIDPTGTDEASTLHYTCCREWTDLGPSMCGSAIDDPAPAAPQDQDCVVCADLYVTDPYLCPRFGRCELEDFS